LIEDIAKDNNLEIEKAIIKNQFKIETLSNKILQESEKKVIEVEKIKPLIISSKEIFAQIKEDSQACLQQYCQKIAYLQNEKASVDEEID